jgi:hypothetical protein
VITAARRTQIVALIPFLLLAALYNPVFNYEALLLRSFTGGSVRAVLSVAVLALVALWVWRTRAASVDRPATRSIAIVGAILAFGTIRGLLNGASLRDVGGDLFPLAEIYVYALLLSWVITDRVSARRGVLLITGWVGLVAAIELILYMKVGYLFSVRVLVEGCTLPRLDDFMPILFVPVAVVGAAAAASKMSRYAMGLAMATLALAIAISFFRTVWVAAAAALVALALAFVTEGRMLVRIALALLVTAVVVVCVLAIFPRLLAFTPVCTGTTSGASTPTPTTATAVPTTTTTVVPTTFATTAPTTEPTALPVGTPTVRPTTRPTTAPTTTVTTVPSVAPTSVASGTSVPGTAVVTTFTPPPFTDLVSGRANPDLAAEEPASFGGRIQANLDMLRGIADNPLVGVGFGGRLFSTTSHQMLPLSSAPDYFPAMVMELGIPASVLLVWITGAELLRVVRIVFAGSGTLAWLGRGSLAGVVGILVTLAIFPALLHFALGPFSVLLLRAARFSER